MNNITFTDKLNMDKTQNFVSQLEKAKAERIKVKDTVKVTALTLSFISKILIFFLQNAIFYSAYYVLSTKIVLLKFSYLEFFIIHLAFHTFLLSIRKFFKPFTTPQNSVHE